MKLALIYFTFHIAGSCTVKLSRFYSLDFAIISILHLYNLQAQVIIFDGISVSQLYAHCLCLDSSKPTCATDGSPLPIAVHLHPPLRRVVASYQPNLELIWHISETSGVCKEQIGKQFIMGGGEVFR